MLVARMGDQILKMKNRDILCLTHKNLNSTFGSVTAAQHKADIQRTLSDSHFEFSCLVIVTLPFFLENSI